MSKFNYILVEDWEGLYRDGILVLEGHSIEAQQVLKLLGHEVDMAEADAAWIHDRGRLPEKLEDVRLA